jgi:hypothetical protein
MPSIDKGDEEGLRGVPCTEQSAGMTLEELRTLLCNATPGPWREGYGPTREPICFQASWGGTVEGINPEWRANLALLDAARNNLPGILDGLDRLSEALREIERLMMSKADGVGGPDEILAVVRAALRASPLPTPQRNANEANQIPNPNSNAKAEGE